MQLLVRSGNSALQLHCGCLQTWGSLLSAVIPALHSTVPTSFFQQRCYQRSSENEIWALMHRIQIIFALNQEIQASPTLWYVIWAQIRTHCIWSTAIRWWECCCYLSSSTNTVESFWLWHIWCHTLCIRRISCVPYARDTDVFLMRLLTWAKIMGYCLISMETCNGTHSRIGTSQAYRIVQCLCREPQECFRLLWCLKARVRCHERYLISDIVDQHVFNNFAYEHVRLASKYRIEGAQQANLHICSQLKAHKILYHC